ncbi:MAG: hypothetical protein LQ348_007790 [Seirophora lacunosa]|nr:MAG: hypothetical protein LQ348_007790 [Seirophora lacunosa]
MSPLQHRNTPPQPLGTFHLQCLQNRLYALGIAPNPCGDERHHQCFKSPLNAWEHLVSFVTDIYGNQIPVYVPTNVRLRKLCVAREAVYPEHGPAYWGVPDVEGWYVIG